MSRLSEMPLVTVEQINRFREAAIAIEQQNAVFFDALIEINNYCIMEMHPDDNDKQFTRLCLIREAIAKAGVK